jgi:signal transduction histidine kinase
VTEIGLGIGFLAAILFEALALANSWGVGYWAFGGAAAVVVCVLALLRRRRPVWAAVAALAVAVVAAVVARVAGLPAEPGPAMALGLSVLTGSAIRWQPPRVAVAIASGGLGVVAAGQIAARPSASVVAPVAGIAGAAWLAAVAVGLALRLLEERARSTAESVRQAERLELARELHDVVAHHVTAMVIQAQAAQVLARRRPGEVAGSLAGIESAGTEALGAMRRVVGLLRDGPAPGDEDLTALVERFGKPVSLRLPDGGVVGSPEVVGTVYRIVQEALTNVSRHAAHARSVTVTVDRDAHDGLTVEVADDAPPPATRRRRGGYGLIGMRERVEMLGGTLVAGPAPAGGWSVRAVLPAGGDSR